MAFDRMQETVKGSEFILIIYKCIRGFSISGLHEDWNDYDETAWMKRGVMLRQLAPLEKELFVRSIDTLMNQANTHLVIDYELI